jgi:excisionase family DNA binding protein
MPSQGTALPPEQGTKRDPAGESRIAYTVAQVAHLLGKHPNTVYGWVEAGKLPSKRIGNTIYIPKWALADLLDPVAGAEPTPTSVVASGEVA